MNHFRCLRLLLGDQLNYQHSWFKQAAPEALYVMMEIDPELTYAPHHIQKQLAYLGAMRQFAREIAEKGHQIVYLELESKDNKHDFLLNLNWLIAQYRIEILEIQQPDEYRLAQQFEAIAEKLPIKMKIFDSEHFITTRNEAAVFFGAGKNWLMESFYRAMRRKTGVLMDGEKPAGGQWNYDKENQKSLPKSHQAVRGFWFQHDYSAIFEQLQKRKIPYTGKADPKAIRWPANRHESLQLLDYFVKYKLSNFGQFQDAMHQVDPYVYHSLLSFSLNTKMLNPLEVIQKAEAAWRNHPNQYPLAAVEGFIRQILGWREYMRGIYWHKMPEMGNANYFEHQHKLPSWFWTGKTKMNCLSKTIGQTLETAYAHHIQRLMITGNFALLAGIDPAFVHEWYLAVYIDALEWVELPNTIGMSQFADGGFTATKPYVSSANYINKMSNYCKSCAYNHKQKTGDKACLFNSLYWHFHERHRDKLGKNARISLVYRNLDKMKTEDHAALMQQAESYLQELDNL